MSAVASSLPSTTLYYREGSSDKIYQTAIEPQGDGFVVTFAYGRRGSTLTTGAKTASPVPFDQAKKMYDKLVKEKTAKGYTPGQEGTPYQQTQNADRATGILPQLLNPIDEAAAEALLDDPKWATQEKFDGKRMLIRRSGDEVVGINRLGLVVALPQRIARRARQLGSQQWIMDGECVGDNYFAFDLLESACIDLRSQPYSKRFKQLRIIIGEFRNAGVRIANTCSSPISKRLMLEQLRKDRAEGIVFKNYDAPYTPGRPASGGDQLKLKFTATASCIVAGINGGKRSVKLELVDGDKRVAVGNVTIPPSQQIPAAGNVAEIRYLYAYPGGALYQPVFLGVREDLAHKDCTIAQLKFKAEGEDES